MPAKPKRTKLAQEREETIALHQHQRYERARDRGHTDYIDMAKTCDAFYKGDQWDEEDIATLEEDGRPIITNNQILPKINAILGEQISRRADIMMKPVRSATADSARIMTRMTKHVMENNKYDWVERTVFEDGIIMDGRGYFDVRMNWGDSVEGDIKIVAEDPLDIIPDPDAKEYDPETWNEVFKTKWASLDDIEATWGKSAAHSLRHLAEQGKTFGEDSVQLEEQRFGDEEGGHGTTDESSKAQVKVARIIERQYRKLMRQDFFQDPNTGDQRTVPEAWDDKKTKKFAKKYGLAVISKLHKKVRWTVTCDRVVLHDDWSPYAGFTIVPYFCYFRRGNPFGAIRNLLSPQEQLNKADSQELHIVNQTANSGWVIQTGSLGNGMTADDLEENGAKSGLVIEYNGNATPPQKIQPNTIPTGLDRIASKAEASIKTISGVSDALLGTDGAEVSGVAIERKQNRGASMMLGPLDNLAKSRHLVAEKIIELIQTFYTEQRVIQITNDDDPTEAPEEMVVNQTTPEGTVVNDLTLGEYGIVITTAPARDTHDDVQFAELVAMRNIGVAIPDDAIVARSNANKKEELAKRIRIRNGEEPPTEEQQKAQQEAKALQDELVQLQIQKEKEEIKELQSRTAVNIAKVQDMSEVAPKLKEMEQNLKKQISDDGLALRRELSAESNISKQNAGEMSSATKLATTAMQKAAPATETNTPPPQSQDEK